MSEYECSECGQDFSEGRPSPGAALGIHRFHVHGIRSPNAGRKGSAARRDVDSTTAPRRVSSSPEPVPELTPLFEPPDEPAILPKKKRFWSDWFAVQQRAPGEIRPTKPGRPRKSHRTSFAPAGSLAWMGGSQVAASMGMVPLSRAMQIQVGIAGEVLDKAVAGTRFDRMVQPFIGDTERFRDLGMLALFPFLVMVCDAQPKNLAAATLLEMVVRQQLHMLAEGVKRMKAEDAKLADTVETLTGIGMDLGDNPVHAILSMVFAPVEPTQQTAPAVPAPGAAAPEPFPSQAPPAPPTPTGSSNGGPVVEPLPFGAVVVTPSDIPPGL